MIFADDVWKRFGEILRARELSSLEHSDSRLHAAVLVPLLEERQELCLLLTQRTHDVPHHKGQISFPGGAVDESDQTWEETALREVQEEIGLAREYVEVLGRIDDAKTISSNFVVHPFVARVVTPSAFRPNPGEVERIITVPLRVFHADDVTARREEVQWDGISYRTPAFEYGSHIIWGATARIIENLLSIIADELRLSVNFK
jgi:8-oxo-dGTP pyrophosphatase MutT (NUDIX family)